MPQVESFNSAVAAYYYLRLIVVMYMREQTVETEPIKVTPAMGMALVLAAIVTIYLGVAPNNVVEYATQGAQNLVPVSGQRTGTQPKLFLPQIYADRQR